METRINVLIPHRLEVQSSETESSDERTHWSLNAVFTCQLHSNAMLVSKGYISSTIKMNFHFSETLHFPAIVAGCCELNLKWKLRMWQLKLRTRFIGSAVRIQVITALPPIQMTPIPQNVRVPRLYGIFSAGWTKYDKVLQGWTGGCLYYMRMIVCQFIVLLI